MAAKSNFGEIEEELKLLEPELIEELETIEVETSHLDDSVQMYLKTIGRIKVLTADEELRTAKETKSENPLVAKSAINKLVNANLRLVVSVAKRFNHTREVPLLDLIQEGNTGLMRAAEKFDFKLGFRFSTYATWWIKQAVKKSVREKKRPIKIPAHITEQIVRMNRAVEKLTSDLGRPPSEAEIATVIDLPRQELELYKEIDGELASLESPLGSEGEGFLSDLISDPNLAPLEENLQRKILRQQLLEVLAQLPVEEQNILTMLYGLNDGEISFSISQVAKNCNITNDRVRRLEFMALRKVKAMLGSDGAKYFQV